MSLQTPLSSPLPGVAAGRSDRGLVIFRASRLEALLEPLRQLLDATWPDDPLAKQTVIAAHPGMKQWLTGALAQRMGRAGVVANLDVCLPSGWIEQLAQQHLGTRAVALPRWQRQHLRWNLYQWLAAPASVPGLEDPRIAAFLSPALDEAERARRRYQLAERLAQLYSRYLVYRPDWLKAWAQGELRRATQGQADAGLGMTESGLLAPLWRQAVSAIGTHRAELVDALIARLPEVAGEAPAVHVFGLSHLAPSELAVLRAYAEHALVALYLPDPCRDYWGVLDGGSAEHWRAEEDRLMAAAAGGDWWRPARHELLARWGRLGQHFFAALLDGEVREDSRHWQDEANLPAENRLARVQQSIRQLDEGLIVPAASVQSELADASLRVHLAHTPQRELEILRDAMLDARAAGIEPGQMLVMAPDIRRYLPLIPAVFGEAGNVRELLPYHCADVPVAQSHPLFAAFLHLLALPASRLEVAEVLDLLALPPLAQRFDLDAEALEVLAEVLAQSRVAWSLDAQHRASFGVPPLAEHGFAWAVDRMLAGFVGEDGMGEAETALHLPDGTELLPLPGLGAQEAMIVGALDALLQAVQGLLARANQVLPASAWASYFRSLAESLLRVDRQDARAQEAWQTLMQTIARLGHEPAVAGVDPALHFAVAADWLKTALTALPERQPFLLGGVTFGGMVPQRAIPFRFIAVLGLDDGQFPRQVEDGGLDLMARLRRQGDRDPRHDDRYLFLETLMSARDRLHLSFIGEGVRDGQPRNPAAPLAELMALLARADAAAGEAMAKAAPWRLRHPLQPFDRRYFDGSDVRLFSYQRQHALLCHASAGAKAEVKAEARAMAATAPAAQLPLAQFKQYWRNPGRQILQRRLRLDLSGLESERLDGHEPADIRSEEADALARRLLFSGALADADWQPAQAPDWLRLSGHLPPAAEGQRAWLNLRERVACVAQRLRTAGLVLGDAAVPSLPVDFALPLAGGEVRLHGRIDSLLPHPAGHWQLPMLLLPRRNGKEASFDFGKRCTFFIDWLLARLLLPPSEALVACSSLAEEDAWIAGLNLADAAYCAGRLPAADLQARLLRLVQWWHEAPALPLRYFPRTSWAAWQAQAKSAGLDAIAKEVRKAWLSDRDNPGERDYAPGYAALFSGGETFAAHSPALAALLAFAAELHATLDIARELAA